jgi:hypothetical protein
VRFFFKKVVKAKNESENEKIYKSVKNEKTLWERMQFDLNPKHKKLIEGMSKEELEEWKEF